MIGITNKDSSFFSIESNDISLSGEDFAKNLISLSITERAEGMPTGSLTFYDPKDIFSRVLRTGVSLAISWGYKDLLTTAESLLAKKLNYDEVTGSIIRRGFKGFVSSPKGGADATGLKTYTCQFTAYGFRGTEESKIYDSTYGTKKNVVYLAMLDIGILPSNMLIDFTLGSQSISEFGIRQDETTFLFLQRLAKEWRAYFQMGFNQLSQPIGVFIDPNKIKSTSYQLLALGATGKSNVIGYMGELNNVKSYTWTSNEAESGIGDNVRLDIVDGKIIFRKFVAAQKTVISYRLDIKKIQDVYTEANDITSQIKLTKELLSKQDFESVKHFFVPIENSTAPFGAGYRIKCDMIGNPLFSPPNQIVINNGFPDCLGASDSVWYIQNVTHSIDRSGYNMNVEIVDAFTLSPIGQVIR